MEVQLKIIGILLLALGLVHVAFPKYFDWKNDLKPLTLINRQMMEVHTFFIAFVVLLMGLLCFTCSNELVNSSFGKIISLGLALFWGMRLIFQFFVYSPKLWKGKKFETVVHIVFSLLWLCLTSVFFIIFIG